MLSLLTDKFFMLKKMITGQLKALQELSWEHQSLYKYSKYLQMNYTNVLY